MLQSGRPRTRLVKAKSSSLRSNDRCVDCGVVIKANRGTAFQKPLSCKKPMTAFPCRASVMNRPISCTRHAAGDSLLPNELTESLPKCVNQRFDRCKRVIEQLYIAAISWEDYAELSRSGRITTSSSAAISIMAMRFQPGLRRLRRSKPWPVCRIKTKTRFSAAMP